MEVSDQMKDRLEKAWELILIQYTKKARETSIQEGPGISIFRFLDKEKNGIFNCEFYYTCKGDYAWDAFVKNSPGQKAIVEIYNPEKHYLISVQIPSDNSEETVGSIRCFEFDTHKEIPLG